MKTRARGQSDANMVWEHLLARPDPARGAITVQVIESFVDAIVSRQIPAGVRVPSTRAMAATLGIGRNTAIAAINSLVEQGYLVVKDRSGVFVAQFGFEAGATERRNEPRETDYDWHRRLGLELPAPRSQPLAPPSCNFRYGQFDPSTFPTSHWRQCERSALGLTQIADWGRDMVDMDDAGLIESLRRHVLPNHGIWAEANEILITLGGQEGRYLVARLLGQAGTTVGLERPGLPDMEQLIRSTAAKRVHLPVDQNGAVLSVELRQCDVIFITPGHQCPTTAVMPVERRQALLDIAHRRDTIVVEDTYDTEVLSHGRMTPSLKSLDREGRVIHIGSLSKAVAPGLRTGFVVASPPVIEALRAIRRLIHRHPPGNIQRTLAMFIDRGYYHSYLRKVSGILQRRREVLSAALGELKTPVRIVGSEGASTFWVEVPASVDTTALSAVLESEGVLVDPGSRFFTGEAPRNYMRIAVSQIHESQIGKGVRRIDAAIRAAA